MARIRYKVSKFLLPRVFLVSSFWYGVSASPAKGITPCDTKKAQIKANQKSPSGKGLYCILRAARRKPTAGGFQRRYVLFILLDQKNTDVFHAYKPNFSNAYARSFSISVDFASTAAGRATITIKCPVFISAVLIKAR